MRAYYNDNEIFACGWLDNLIAAGELPDGYVDDRPIQDVKPEDLASYEHAHFFAGVGGWPLALRWAGWRGPVWTGSCPCQPLSGAGKRQGHADKRHLWPAWYHLIEQCRPPAIFGEQVASPLGREWFAAVQIDLEELGYACGAANLPAACVGAPHIRERLFWVAYDASGKTLPATERGLESEYRHTDDWLDDADKPGLARRRGESGRESGQRPAGSGSPPDWSGVEYIACADGKARPVKPGVWPLADGVPGRVGMLRAYGNAIVPQVGAAFVRAVMEYIDLIEQQRG